MATKRKIAEIIASIKTVYSYYAKDIDFKALAKLWEALLSQYPDDAVEQAFLLCLQTCKMPPTPADIVAQIETASKASGVSEYELWDILTRALRETVSLIGEFGYTIIDRKTGLSQGRMARQRVAEIWNGLPEVLKQYLASKGEMMRMSQMSESDLRYERQRFLKAIGAVTEQVQIRERLSAGKDTDPILNGSERYRIGG